MQNQENVFNTLYANYKKFVLNKKETASELHISQANLDRLRKDGDITSKKIGGQVFFTLEEVARFLAV